MDLSIVVPFYNEQESIRPFYKAVTEAVKNEPISYELLMVDDGSTDKTFQIAAELAKQDKHVKVISFRRNYGQTPAMAAGINNAQGTIIVTLDGDLQNDPADIPMMLEQIGRGYDLVVGWRFNRQDKLITRKIPSKIANWIIGKVTGIPIKDNGCSLKAYRASVIKEIPLYSEMHRFIPAMASISGARIAEVKVRHHARQFGESKYGLARIYKVMLDLLTIKTLISFSTHPLYWFSILASPFFLLGAVFIANSVYFTTSWASSVWVATGGTGLLFGSLSIFLFCTGIFCELVYRFGDLSLEKFYKYTTVDIDAVEMSNPGHSQQESGGYK